MSENTRARWVRFREGLRFWAIYLAAMAALFVVIWVVDELRIALPTFEERRVKASDGRL